MLWLECSSALVQLKDPPAVDLQGALFFFSPPGQTELMFAVISVMSPAPL